MLKIGFVGLDSTGQKIVSHIMEKKGHPIMGYDIQERNREIFHENGGISVEDPDIIYENCDLILLRQPNALMVTKCIEDVLDTMRHGLTIINISSTFPMKMTELKIKLKSYNISYLNAPVVDIQEGGDDFPELIGMYGEKEDFEKIEDFMRKTLTNVTYLGLM